MHVIVPNFFAKPFFWRGRSRKIWGTVGPRSLGMWAWLTPGNMLLPTCVSTPNSVILYIGQTEPYEHGDLPENSDPHVPPFKVTDRSATYDHNHEPFSEIKCDSVENRKLPYPRVFNGPAEEFPWNFVTAVALKKLVLPISGGGIQFDDTCIRFDTIPARV